jgi:hypothetical protein
MTMLKRLLPSQDIDALPGEFVAIFGTLFVSIPAGILAGGILGLRWKLT